MSIISPQEISLPLKKKNNYSIFIFWHTKIASYLLKLIKCWSDGGIFSCFLITRSFNLNVFLLWPNVSILEYWCLDLKVSSINCLRNLFFLFLVIIPSVEPQPLLLLATSGNLFFFFFPCHCGSEYKKSDLCSCSNIYRPYNLHFPFKISTWSFCLENTS